MKQLVTIALFLLLLCLFDTIAAMSNDNNLTMGYDVITSKNDENPPSSCLFNVKSVSIILYTSDIPKGKFVQVNESCDLFDSSKPVFFMAHGFLLNATNIYSGIYFSELASSLLKRGYAAVFSLDWTNASCSHDLIFPLNVLEYLFAVRNTREVGDFLASNIKSVIDSCNVPLKSITLMGHSLGAHICAFAAKNLQQTGYGKPPLLIGSDPAFPLFALRNCEDKFCDTDAERVVVLHTSFAGIQKSLGHLDLWFHNGLGQPACGFWLLDILNVICAHNIAIMYLANTLKDDCVFIGNPVPHRTNFLESIWLGCSSNRTDCIVVDNRIFDPNYSVKGDYCVSVSSKYPYCGKNDFSCQK